MNFVKKTIEICDCNEEGCDDCNIDEEEFEEVEYIDESLKLKLSISKIDPD